MSRFIPNIPFMNKKPSQELIDLAKLANVQVSSISLLLDGGKDPFMKDKSQQSAFDYAIKAGNLEVAHLMFQHPHKEIDLSREIDSLEALTLAELENKKNDPASLNKIIDFSEKSKIEAVNSQTLFYIMKSDNPDISKITSLLVNGANPYEEYENKSSVFKKAVTNDNMELAHLIYQLSPNHDYKDILENTTIVHLRQNRSNIADINKIVSLSKKNSMPEVQKQAEIIMYEEGIKTIPQTKMSIMVNGVKTVVERSDDIVITPEIIAGFSNFIDQKPLLGNDLSGSKQESLIYPALHFSLSNFHSDPNLLNKVTNLFLEQNPDNKQLKQELTNILIVYSNKLVSSYKSALQMDSLIKSIGGEITNYAFGSLSEEHKEALLNISELMDKENIQSKLENALDENSLIKLHRDIQLIQGIDLPHKLISSIDSNVYKITQNFFNKQVKDENIEAISRMSKVACDTKSYMNHTFDGGSKSSVALEELHVKQLIEQIIGNDVSKLNESQLEKFSQLLDKNPSIGSISDEKSLGRIILDISVLYAKEKPELLEKVTKIMKDNQTSNEFASYSKALLLIGSKTDHLSQKQLDDFIGFLKSDPSPTLGDENSDKSLAKITLEIADKYPKIKKQVLDIYNALIEDEINLKNATTTHFIEGSNLSLDEKQRKSLTDHIVKNLYKELSCENQQDVAYLLKSTSEAKNPELLNSIILANKGNIKLSIEHSSLEDLFIHGYKEATKELLYSPESTSRYLDSLSKNNSINHDLIKFIYDNKADGTTINSPRTIEALVDIASKTQDYKMLSEIVHNTIFTKDELLINSSLTEVLKNNDLKYFNSLVTDIISSETMTANQKHTFAQTILKDEKYINNLDSNTISALAPHYEPKIDSSKFLGKLLDKIYLKGDSRENLIQKVEFTLIKTDQQTIINPEEFQKSFDNFLEVKKYHEKKPIMTMIKAFSSGKSSKDYKQVQIDESLSIVENNLKSCIMPYVPKPEPLPSMQNAQGQAAEALKGKENLPIVRQDGSSQPKKTTQEQIEEIKTYASKALKTAFAKKQQEVHSLKRETSRITNVRH